MIPTPTTTKSIVVGDNAGSSSSTASTSGESLQQHPSFGRRSAKAKTDPIFQANLVGPPTPLRSDGRRKRVHPTSEQQRLLEAFFAENPKPNSKRRLEISEAVNINVRSVQIWFQNRRTRLKRQPKLEGEVDEAESSTIETETVATTTSPVLSESVQQQQQQQQPLLLEPLPLSTASQLLVPPFQTTSAASPFYPIASPTAIPAFFSSTSETTQISVSNVSIGTWQRLSLSVQDLLLEVSTASSLLRYTFFEGGLAYKLELPLAAILNLTLQHSPTNPAYSSLTINIGQMPLFYMEASGGGMFVPCEDFTEGRQASTCWTHVVNGGSNDLERIYSIFMEYFEDISRRNQQQQLHTQTHPLLIPVDAGRTGPLGTTPGVSPVISDSSVFGGMVGAISSFQFLPIQPEQPIQQQLQDQALVIPRKSPNVSPKH